MTGDLITVAQARELVLGATPALEHEPIAVVDALDRVLAQDVLAAGDVPPFASSAMDGYAVSPGAAGRSLLISGESRAGSPSDHELGSGEAIRISTGAAVPTGATAVIRQEDVAQNGSTITTNVAISDGQNVRGAGEDLRAGTTVLTAGTVLGATELGVAVAAGVGAVRVSRRPRVTVLCTGDELRAPGEPLEPGQIHNSNAPMLAALATRSGAVLAEVRRLADDRAATEASLAQALDKSDVLIISGGVSVGPHDHVKPALAALGVEQVFWRVALQPGKPTWFGRRDGRLVFGLPGNPVSAFVTFSLFARPALAAMQGAAPERMLETEAVLGISWPRNRGREQAVRVRLERRDSKTFAYPTGPQGSHLMTSLLGADALAMIPPGGGEVQAGSVVALQTLPS